jgi:Zn finger protein HypA/HybF involved in hydrogenase expression
MESLKLDGNAAAGILHQVFGIEVTAASGTCAGCSAVSAVGALAAYTRAPGIVLRCPHCESVLMKIATDGERVWIDFRGLRALELHGV